MKLRLVGSSVTWFPIYLILILASELAGSEILAASSDSALLAKQQAESKGYLFVTSHDEIMRRAKGEARLRVTVSVPDGMLKALSDAFMKKYPFIDTRAGEIRGAQAYLRQLQEIKAGLIKGLDVNDLAADYYDEYLPHQKKVDILSMAEQGVLQIPRQMIDPINRNVVAVGSGIHVVAYNKKLISANKIPDTWDSFLKPEFKDGKFALDIRPREVSALVPAWGYERTVDFARKLAAQKPVWISGNTRALIAMLAGEYALYFGPNVDSVLRVKDKDLTDALGYKLIEPVPVRLTETYSVLNTAEHPYSALLWLEFLASPEGQKIFDKAGPYEGSVFIPGTVQEQAVRGKKLSVVDWHHYTKIEEYQKKIIEAYGFPSAEGAGKK